MREVDNRLVALIDEGSQRTIVGLDGQGKVVWEYTTQGDGMFFLHELYVLLGGREAVSVDSRTGTVVAKVDWRSTERYGALHRPTARGAVYHLGQSRRLAGFRVPDLSMLWQWPDPGEDYTAHDDFLCRYDEQGEMTFVDLDNGMQPRTVSAPPRSTIVSLHAHVGGLFCDFALSEGGRTGIDTRTGEVVWAASQPSGYGLPVFGDDTCYTQVDGLVAYDLSTGRERWRTRLTASPVSAATLVEGRLYQGTEDGRIHVLDAETGEVLLSFRLDFELTGWGHEPSPVRPFGENRIVVGTRREIICLEVA